MYKNPRQSNSELAPEESVRPKRRPSRFSNIKVDPEQQVAGLGRRPKARPEPQEETLQDSIGSILSTLQDSDSEMTSSLRPQERPYEMPSGDDRQSFIDKLTFSESSGNPDAEVNIKDGRRFVGLGQFGKARLKDYKTATGQKFTQDEFKADVNLQKKVMDWHISDIDKQIGRLEAEEGIDLSKWDRNGLRAVAHLGGTPGMKKFVKTNMKYNPQDEFKTSLKDYYTKFGEGS